jgi:hypothetical protein
MTYSDSIDLYSTLSGDEIAECFVLVLLYFITSGATGGEINKDKDKMSWYSVCPGTCLFRQRWSKLGGSSPLSNSLLEYLFLE